jgi:hypothetical protein
VTFDPPAVGATIRAFGLHDVTFEGSRVFADGKFEHIEFKSEQSISTGTVKQHHWNGRDSVMYNFPCFEVDAKFESGMSGGLVIDEESKVCGIVCGSLHGASEDEEHVSYVTMLWPMMAIPVPSKLVIGGLESARYRLRDLSAQGKFNPYGWERVLIEDGNLARVPLTIRYQRKQ